MCVNFIPEWRDLQFNVDSEGQIFEQLYMAILFTLRVFARNLLKDSPQKNIFVLMSDLDFEPWPYYQLDYGNQR